MKLQIKITERDVGIFTVFLNGPLDTKTHGLLDQNMERLFMALPKAIILDMKDVDYISSMGIGSIFKIRKFCQDSDARMALVHLQPQVKRIMDMVQALPSEPIFSSIEEIDAYLDELQGKAKPDNKPYSL